MTPDGARGRAVVVVAAAAIFAASPLVSGGFGGFDAADFPVPQDDPPSQPAGWAFSIWGVIYVWLIAHAGFGLLRRDVDVGWDRTRLPLLVALGVGAAWIPVAQRDPVLATVLIAVMAAAAVLALLRAPSDDRWWAAAPIGLFAGWLTAATGASLGILLGGWGLVEPVTAAVLALVATLLVASTVMAVHPEPAYVLAVAWALAAIVWANGMAQPVVSMLALVGAAGLLLTAFRMRRT